MPPPAPLRKHHPLDRVPALYPFIRTRDHSIGQLGGRRRGQSITCQNHLF